MKSTAAAEHFVAEDGQVAAVVAVAGAETILLLLLVGGHCMRCGQQA